MVILADSSPKEAGIVLVWYSSPIIFSHILMS